MQHKHILYTALLCTLTLAGCTATPPKQYTETNTEASVHPQYTNGITIPYNIAPLNFAYTMEGKAFITELQAGDQSLVIKGKQTALL